MHGRLDSAAHAAAIAKVGEITGHIEEFRSHLEDILRSPAFSASQRGRAFLRYVVEHALDGEFDELRERNIGVALFGRPAAYDTAEDAIVRVTASDVRKRLLQFYGFASAPSPYRIELPSGSYVPEFRCLTVPATPEVHVKPLQPIRRRRFLALASAVVVMAVTVAGWALHDRILIVRVPPPNLISTAFQDSPGPIQVITSDDALVLIQVLLGRRFTLQEYENLSHIAMPDVIRQKGLERFWASLSTRQITNLGDLQNTNRIADNLRQRGWNVVIRHARQANARDFRSGNFIILGSRFSNPWADLFSPEDSDFTVPEAAPGQPATIVNRDPKPGEAGVYLPEVDPKTGKKVAYARVWLRANTAHSGRVLLVAGTSMSSTEMAGEYLLHPEAVASVARLLGVPAAGPLPDCEMLLRITEVNEIGDSVALIACHRQQTTHPNTSAPRESTLP
jgi:hypothetical protein